MEVGRDARSPDVIRAPRAELRIAKLMEEGSGANDSDVPKVLRAKQNFALLMEGVADAAILIARKLHEASLVYVSDMVAERGAV